MTTKFGEWLLLELEKRDWSQAELARKSGVTRQAINAFVNQRRMTPDNDTLIGIASALNEPPETVYRAAGLLPELPSIHKARQEILDYKLSELSEEELDQVLEYIDFIHERKTKPKYTRQGERPGEVVKSK